MVHRPPSTRALATAASLALAAGLIVGAAPPAAAQQTIGYPEFTGGDAVPDEPVPYTVDGMMPAMYGAEAGGTDFWMDRLLAREGADPAGDAWLMTRGRALLMRVHDPDVIGFGGQLAYYDPFFDRASNTDGFTIDIGDGDFTEVAAERRQTPSHWTSVHEGGDLTAEVQKFITDNNVAVANVTVTNNGAAATVPVRVDSDFAWQASGEELTGVLDVRNSRGERLTTVFPRLSGTGLAPEDGSLTGELELAQGEVGHLQSPARHDRHRDSRPRPPSTRPTATRPPRPRSPPTCRPTTSGGPTTSPTSTSPTRPTRSSSTTAGG